MKTFLLYIIAFVFWFILGNRVGKTLIVFCAFNCNVTGFVWFVFPGGLQGTDWLLTAVRCVEKSRTAHQKTSAGADEHGK